jgi:hypothetical protein
MSVIRKTKCEENKKKGMSVQWVPAPEERPYACFGIPGCEESYGHCRITDKKTCMDLSAPVDPTGHKKTVCESDSDCGSKKMSCRKNPVQKNERICVFNDPYLEWHLDASSPWGGKCVYGNIALRRFCDYPESRPSRVLKDQGPFRYDSNTSQCFMTEKYCKEKGLDFRSGPPPDCHLSEKQKIGEMFLGKTLFRSFKTGNTAWLNPDEHNLVTSVAASIVASSS